MNSQLPVPHQRLPIVRLAKIRLLEAWPAVLILGAWLFLFWPMITGQAVCGFRDSAYLYYPLFKWIDTQLAAGDIPLWNPYNQYGAPLVADGASSLFYPGKLVFFLRVLSFESRYGLYVASHVLIAAGSCYWLARRMGCKQSGATIAAMGYGFGGSVLFQVCNVIFLVGAAWLPVAIGSLWLMLKKKSFGWAVVGGLFCALIVLGGDPQMAYNIGLIGLATIAMEFFRECRRGRCRQGLFQILKPFQRTAVQIARLAVLVFVTTVLSAVQILPTIEWAADSERAQFQLPRSIYEMAIASADPDRVCRIDDTFTAWVRAPRSDTHSDHVFQFSQPIWTLCELLIPNLSGQPFPVNGRWSAALPGADRMWVPSLYSGCLIAILGLSSVRLWGKRRRQIWLSRIGVFFVLGSFGWYGLGWLVGEFVDLKTLPIEMGPQVGGVYWLLIIGVPKYVMFRYPAKLFVIGSLALCVLAGIGLSQIRSNASASCTSALKLVSITSLIGFVVLPLFPETLLNRFWDSVPSDPLFGPFDSLNATWTFQLGLLQLFLVTLVGLGALIKIKKTGQTRYQVAFAFVVLVDLLLANHWMVANVSSEFFTRQVNHAIPESGLRIVPYPAKWTSHSSRNRLEEIVTWQRSTLFPKHHLEIPIRHPESFSSIERRHTVLGQKSSECAIELTYHPVAFYRGAWISGIGWIAIILLLGASMAFCADGQFNRHLRLDD